MLAGAHSGSSRMLEGAVTPGPHRDTLAGRPASAHSGFSALPAEATVLKTPQQCTCWISAEHKALPRPCAAAADTAHAGHWAANQMSWQPIPPTAQRCCRHHPEGGQEQLLPAGRSTDGRPSTHARAEAGSLRAAGLSPRGQQALKKRSPPRAAPPGRETSLLLGWGSRMQLPSLALPGRKSSHSLAGAGPWRETCAGSPAHASAHQQHCPPQQPSREGPTPQQEPGPQARRLPPGNCGG